MIINVYYFFTKFTVPTGCGALTYTLIDGVTNNAIAASVAVIDEVALVQGKMRVFLKDASALGTHIFKVVATNPFGIAITSDIVTV